MNAPTMIPTATTPAERILARFDRRQLAGFIEVAISLLDMADGDPDLEPSGFHEGYSHDARSADQRDAETYLAAHEDDEDDDPAEDDGTGNEDDDANEDDDPAGGSPDDEGEGFTAVECISQVDWIGASCAHGDGLRHEDEEDDDPAGRRTHHKRLRSRIAHQAVSERSEP